MNKNAIIVTSVGMVIGVAEALLYYNLGQSAGGKFAYKIPPTKEFFKTVGVVLVTSILTAGISAFIESRFEEDKKQIA
ncbi:MAG TPA: hypothetical protein VLB84_02475 [Bacteroidia bacterium]|nr:hypothetical protein [Bacteroidia bacterium]